MQINTYEEACSLLSKYPSFTFAAIRAIELTPTAAEAERLRIIVSLQTGTIPPHISSVKEDAEEPDFQENPEISARKLIKNQKYAEALTIIEDLNLKNPEKSIYFVDQIRFLKKLILNQAKANC